MSWQIRCGYHGAMHAISHHNGNKRVLAGLALLILCLPRIHAEHSTRPVPPAASTQDETEADFLSGRACEHGQSVPPDYEKAAQWYQKAAERGHAKAQNNLASLYARGLGVRQNYAQAARWYRLAAAQGAALAQDSLGVLLENGRGVPQNNPEAARWYRKAAEQGLLSAQIHLGSLCYFGAADFPKDHNAVFKWATEAARKNNAWGQNTLGVLYENGFGVKKETAKAAAWYQRAANQGDAKGQSNLGRCYLDGIGVKKDYAAAYQWLTLSKAQGEITADKALAELHLVISESQINEGKRLLKSTL